MTDEREYERRIERVLTAARRAARALADDSPGNASDGSGVVAISGPDAAVAADDTMASPSLQLVSCLGLSGDELDLVWTAVARAVDPRVAATLREVFGNDARSGVSLSQQIALGRLTAARSRKLLAVLDPRHPLRANGVLVAAEDDAVDVQTRWTAPARVWRYLLGNHQIDAAVAQVGGPVLLPDAQLSVEQREVLVRLAGWLARGSAVTVVLEGTHGSGRRTAVALAQPARQVIAADFTRIAARRAEGILFALRREALLQNAIPVLANLDELWSRLPPGDEVALSISAMLDTMPGPTVVTTSTSGLDFFAATRMVLRMRWPLPDISTRRALWQHALPNALVTGELDLVSVRYQMGAGGIHGAARSAQHRASYRGATDVGFDDIAAGVQDNIAERLGELAHRVVVQQDWSELSLSPDTLDDIRALIGRVRHSHSVLDGWGFRRKMARGSGVAALFSGPPGTGKTMVAGLIARELQLELYQVDLSRIVSKWVGETEKQLARVFEAAEAGHALLLFDEADALFAKRSAEVKSAVDRYANLEVNYLLQRVESFGGVVILTTNLDASIDPALRRRLASHIVFTVPDVEERRQVWESMLATGAPLAADVNLDDLADEFSTMTGANIRNAVLSAAFLAAEEGATIGASHLRRAALGEYRAMGRVLGKDNRSPSGRSM